jgi:hypothetical protein
MFYLYEIYCVLYFFANAHFVIGLWAVMFASK